MGRVAGGNCPLQGGLSRVGGAEREAAILVLSRCHLVGVGCLAVILLAAHHRLDLMVVWNNRRSVNSTRAELGERLTEYQGGEKQVRAGCCFFSEVCCKCQ